MKSGLVAVDPSIKISASFQSFCNTVRFFQAHGLFARMSVASIIHSDLYSVPYKFYKELRESYVEEAKKKLHAACSGCLSYDTLQVLVSESNAKEDHINLLTRYAHRLRRDLLVLASSNRADLSHLILGSYSETASLMAKLPVFVIKPSLNQQTFTKKAHFVLAVDITSPPSSNAVRWIADFAKPAHATIDLLYVHPRKGFLVDSLKMRKPRHEAEQALEKLQSAFAKHGLKTKSVVLEESESVAETAAAYSEKTKAWVTIATEAVRTKPRKLLMGSTARKILVNTKRPFLSLRMV